MNYLLPPQGALLWLSLGVCVAVILAAVLWAPWRQVMAVPVRQHVLMCCVLGLSLVWLFGVQVKHAVIFHPILMTATTMVLGWHLAVLAGVLALILTALFRLALKSAQQGWDMAFSQLHISTIPLDFCLNIAVPASLTIGIIFLVKYWQLKNPFFYLLGVGFVGAMACVWCVDLAALTLFYLAGSNAHWVLIQDHFWLFLLMTFPEGFINGTIATACAVFLPDLVKTYEESWFAQQGK